MSMSATVALTQATWLCPRPLARSPSRFPLIPLLPHKPVCKHLPSEVWSEILEHVFNAYAAVNAYPEDQAPRLRLGLLLVSKEMSVSRFLLSSLFRPKLFLLLNYQRRLLYHYSTHMSESPPSMC